MTKRLENPGKGGRKPLPFDVHKLCVLADKGSLAVVDRMRGKRSRGAMIRDIIAEWARVRRRHPGQHSSDTPDKPMESVETEPVQAAEPGPALPSVP